MSPWDGQSSNTSRRQTTSGSHHQGAAAIRTTPGWRRWFVGAGLLSCGANLVLFIKWQVYMHGSFDPFIGAVARRDFKRGD
jgi:hypothetical protein